MTGKATASWPPSAATGANWPSCGIWPNKAWKNYDLDMLKAQLKMIDDYPSGGYAIFSYGAIFPKHEPNDFAKYIKEFNDARPLSDKDKKR